MAARTLGIIGALLLAAGLIAGTAIDPTTPAVVASIMGVIFGFILGVIAVSDD